MQSLYILLIDQIANRRERGLLAAPKVEDTLVLQGSLWQSVPGEQDGLTLTSREFDGVVLHCDVDSAAKITQKEYDHLVALNTCSDRHKMFKDKDLLNECISIEKGDIVYILKIHDLPEKVAGKVKYKGNLPGHQGIWYGVELTSEYHGKGTTDGTFRRNAFFTSPMDSALFVPLNKIRKCHDPSQFREYSFPSSQLDQYDDEDEKPPLAIGERVVWMSDNGPEHGTVKWIGFLHDTRDKEWTVGVEFDNPIGTGTGKYKDRQLFRAKQNHASLVPILGLMKESELIGPAPPARRSRIPHTQSTLSAEELQVTLPDKNTRVTSSAPGGFRQRGPEHNSSKNSTPSPTHGDLLVHSKTGSTEESGSTAALNLVSQETGRQKDEFLREQMAMFEQYEKSRPRNLQRSSYQEYDTLSKKNQPTSDDFMKRGSATKRNCSGSIYDKKNAMEIDTLLLSTKDGSTRSQNKMMEDPIYEIQRSSKDLDFLDDTKGLRYKIPEMDNGGTMPISPPTGRKHTPTPPLATHSRSYSNSSQGSQKSNPSSRKTVTPSSGPSPTEPIKEHSLKASLGSAVASPETEDGVVPVELCFSEVDTDLELGSMVEVTGNLPACHYGVVRWLGYYKDRNKPIVGLEMEDESSACTEGTFCGKRLFECNGRKAFFVYLHKCRKDPRFAENWLYIEKGNSQGVFGNKECPEVGGTVPPPVAIQDVNVYCGKGKGIQGHHNSCYLDASLFSMFAFTVVFDSILYRQPTSEDIEGYEEVQKVLKETIVNPLRKHFFVRADKVLKLRTLLDKMSSVKGLTTEEKDPEEFLNSLLQQIMKADPFIKLSNGQECYYYQLFMEKDDRLVLPTTQQLLALSFLQSDIKLAEVPSCLILQMPRFGKSYKMYKRIVPSLYLDITDILEYGPRECTICGQMATYECKECYTHFGDGLDQIAFCHNCLKKSHSHAKRLNHKPCEIKVHQEYRDYISGEQTGGSCSPVPRETMELFAVVSIETSHYVAFVKCGTGPKAPWVFFDSMADRMGEQHGYNVPEVRECTDLTNWFSEQGQVEILALEEDKLLPELIRRLLCDSYMCMYQSVDTMMYK